MAKLTRKQIAEASKKGAELAAKSRTPASQKHIKRLAELKQKAHKRLPNADPGPSSGLSQRRFSDRL